MLQKGNREFTLGLNSVDGGGDQWQEAADDEVDDPETLEAERAMRGRRGLEKVFQNFARAYI